MGRNKRIIKGGRRMNKFYTWQYNKTRAKLLAEVEESGLRILDEDKFNQHVKESTKRNIKYNIIFIILIIAIIIKWIIT